MLMFLLALLTLASTQASVPEDVKLVKAYIKIHGNETFKEPLGYLKFPYLVPAGPYNQSWDWDSFFTGVALLDYGSSRYLAGSMKNFLASTSENGFTAICQSPDDLHPSCSSMPNNSTAVAAHAKPLIIQGAWLAANHENDYEQFREFVPKMKALLNYWEENRFDTKTGLYVWHDQMEGGADNMVISPCPSERSDCWVEKGCGDSLSAADVMSWLVREHRAMALFMAKFGDNDASLQHTEKSTTIMTTLNKVLLKSGSYIAYNVTSQSQITNSVYLLGFPLFIGSDVIDQQQAYKIVSRLSEPDMNSPWGVRSTSSLDPNYSNENLIYPYSNWRGPVWVVSNAILAYGMNNYGFNKEAVRLAEKTIQVLAKDLRDTGTWHECFDSSEEGEATTGMGLAAEGFLSWNVLGINLLDYVKANRNPFDI